MFHNERVAFFTINEASPQIELIIPETNIPPINIDDARVVVYEIAGDPMQREKHHSPVSTETERIDLLVTSIHLV